MKIIWKAYSEKIGIPWKTATLQYPQLYSPCPSALYNIWIIWLDRSRPITFWPLFTSTKRSAVFLQNQVKSCQFCGEFFRGIKKREKLATKTKSGFRQGYTFYIADHTFALRTFAYYHEVVINFNNKKYLS